MGVEDIFHELQDIRAETIFKSRKMKSGLLPIVADLSEEESLLLEKLTYSPVHVDILMRETQIALRRINELLLTLEIKGLVQQAPGHCYFKI
jgi:DNA processing protein